MKIAFVVPYVPNLIRTRPYNLIVHLGALGHEVEVFTIGSGVQDFQDAEALKRKSRAVHYYAQPLWRSLWNTMLAVPSRQPLQAVYSWHGGMANALAGRLSNGDFDVVHVEHLRGSRYARFIKSRFPGLSVVWDSVDSISHLFQQASGQSSGFFGKFVTRFELPRTRKAEGELICSFDHVLVTSVVDRDALLSLTPPDMQPARLSVLPNGVDLEYFRPNPVVQREPETLVFSGKMSYHANVAMVKYLVNDILPRVWAKRPGVRLIVVGKDPGPDIRDLGQDPRITITGTVEDIRPYLWRATASVVPLLYGAGIQNKILEAMATGTPVITTSRTLASLDVRVGEDVFVADDAGAFAECILQVLGDHHLAGQVGGGGLRYVQSHHNWSVIAGQLAEIYFQIATRPVKN